jgi:hypothetical protein
MADDTPPQLSRQHKRRSHHSPKVRIGKPPLRIRPTPKTSRTSPRTLARRKRINEALEYRQQGATFEQIARQMKVSQSVAHGYVVEGLNLIPLENAKAVLALELQRLDGLLSAHYSNVVAGDTVATAMTLRILDQRARLLGLYPEYGKTAAVLVSALPVGEPIQVEFVVPSRPEPPHWEPPAGPKLLPAPEPMKRDAFGIFRPLGRTE